MTTTRKISALIPLLLLSFMFVGNVALAQNAPSTQPKPGGVQQCDTADATHPCESTKTTFELSNPFAVGNGDLSTLIKEIISKILMPLAGILAVIMFIYVGFKFVMAKGNATEITTAKRAFLYTAIGTALLLGASVVLNVLQGTVNSLK